MASSSTSAVTVVGSAGTLEVEGHARRVIGESRRAARALTVCCSRRSTRSPRAAVKRDEISASSCRSSASLRPTRVTAVPYAENTWANSAATYPAPTMIIDRGSSGSRITVSEVSYGVSASPSIVRDPDPGTGRDDEPVRGDLGAVVEPQSGLGDEAAVLTEQADVPTLRPVALARRRDRVDPAEDAVPDLAPPDPVEGEVHPERAGVLGRAGQVGRMDVHLGRDAADVEAGATEGAALDQRDAPVVEAFVGDGVGRSAADDAQVDVSGLRHAPMVPGRFSTAAVVTSPAEWARPRLRGRCIPRGVDPCISYGETGD